MKQVVQDARSGRVTVEDVPPPAPRRGTVIVRTAASVVSAGTERDMLAFARRSLLGKARERPDLVRQVIDKVRTAGLAETYRAVTARLDDPLPLGYSSAGTVLSVGAGVEGFAPGDRVACAGAGHATHSEIVAVPRNLCVAIPDRGDGSSVPFDEAAFATLGAIALQGVRLVAPTLGERVAVVGLGVIGQLACQLLRAAGCAVFAVDTNDARVALARELGAAAGGPPDRTDAIAEFTRERGADAVLIAAATPSSAPVQLAGEVSRRKGRVVVVGNVGMEIPRRAYYERELSLTVSSSYGPGRYDPAYEQQGSDYPFAYVRWTAQRNMEAFLDALATGTVRVSPLISHRFEIDRAEEALALIGDDPPAPSLGIVLLYPSTEDVAARPVVPVRPAIRTAGAIGVAAVGAGSFARTILFPRLKRLADVRLRTVSTTRGVSAASAARRFGFENAATSYEEVVGDGETSVVFVLTRHSLHATQAIQALRAGKHVFVEKPLCVDPSELAEIASAYRSMAGADAAPVLAVGFNRRFSPLAVRLRDSVAGGGPIVMSYRVNAGPLPREHWLQDPAEGGRIVGEACHFVDLASFVTGALPRRVFAVAAGRSREPTDLVIELSDGSILDLIYLHDGPRGLPKERAEVFQGPRAWVLDDWRSLSAIAQSGTKRFGSWGQQKGYEQELDAFFEAIRGRTDLPIAFESLLATTATTFAALESLRVGRPIDVAEP